MRSLRVGSLLLLAAGLLAGCGAETAPAWAGAIEEREGVVWVNNPAPVAEDRPALALRLEQTYGEEEASEETILSFITSVAVDDNGRVYALDSRESRIVAFDADGTHRWTGGRPGQGPGELDRAYFMAWNGDDLLFVDNHSGSKIDVWTIDGEFVTSYGLSAYDIGQGFVAGAIGRTLVVRAARNTQGDGARIHVFDVEETLTHSMDFFALAGREAADGEQKSWASVDVAVGADGIWTGNQLRYDLRRYDLHGELRRVVAADVPDLPAPIEYRGTGTWFGEFLPPLPLGDGKSLVARQRRSGVRDHDHYRLLWDAYMSTGERDPLLNAYEAAVDLLDSEGRILATLDVDGPYWNSIGVPEASGPDGSVYTRVADPYPHVRRYRVEYTGNSS